MNSFFIFIDINEKFLNLMQNFIYSLFHINISAYKVNRFNSSISLINSNWFCHSKDLLIK